MPYALVLTTASKANTTGGTFADSLTANTGDSLSVANYDTGGARIIEAWAIDSDSVAEIQLIYTRPQSTHDQQHGVRFQVPALLPGGAGSVAAHNLLPGLAALPVFKSDTPTLQVTSTAGDDVVMSWLTEYDDLPGATGQFADWGTVQNMRKSSLGFSNSAQASGTPGAYGTSRALNADDDRFHADTYYAILGFTVRTVCTTIALTAPSFGGQKIGAPAGVSNLETTWFWVDLSLKYGKGLIPVFNSNDKANVLVQVADGEASTTPTIDFHCFELTGNPVSG